MQIHALDTLPNDLQQFLIASEMTKIGQNNPFFFIVYFNYLYILRVKKFWPVIKISHTA